MPDEGWTTEVGDGVAMVEASIEKVTVSATWGGWHWQAEGQSEEDALRRLHKRLATMNPFDGSDTDRGDPGYQVGPLDESIPEATRAEMARHQL